MSSAWESVIKSSDSLDIVRGMAIDLLSQCGRYKRKLETERAFNGRVIEMLRDIEWAYTRFVGPNDTGNGAACFFCCAQQVLGHADDCELAAALSAYGDDDA